MPRFWLGCIESIGQLGEKKQTNKQTNQKPLNNIESSEL